MEKVSFARFIYRTNLIALFSLKCTNLNAWTAHIIGKSSIDPISYFKPQVLKYLTMVDYAHKLCSTVKWEIENTGGPRDTFNWSAKKLLHLSQMMWVWRARQKKNHNLRRAHDRGLLNMQILMQKIAIFLMHEKANIFIKKSPK